MAADASYRLTRKSKSDLEDIWEYSARTWSASVADRYLAGLIETLALLANHPFLARERREFSPPVRLHRYRSHLVVYRIEVGRLVVVRVLHGRQEWSSLIEED